MAMLNLVLAFLMAGATPAAASQPATPPAPLPAIDVSTQTGARVKLSEWRDRPVVVTFWATWCGVCREELAALQRVADSQGANVRILAVASDEQGWKTVLPFLKQHSYRLPVTLLTPRLSKAFALEPTMSVIPQTLVFGRDGTRVAHLHEAVSEAALLRLIAVASGHPSSGAEMAASR